MARPKLVDQFLKYMDDYGVSIDTELFVDMVFIPYVHKNSDEYIQDLMEDEEVPAELERLYKEAEDIVKVTARTVAVEVNRIRNKFNDNAIDVGNKLRDEVYKILIRESRERDVYDAILGAYSAFAEVKVHTLDTRITDEVSNHVNEIERTLRSFIGELENIESMIKDLR